MHKRIEMYINVYMNGKQKGIIKRKVEIFKTRSMRLQFKKRFFEVRWSTFRGYYIEVTEPSPRHDVLIGPRKYAKENYGEEYIR